MKSRHDMSVREYRHDRRCQPDDPRDHQQQRYAEDQGKRQPDLTGTARGRRGKTRDQNRNEHDVVDAQNDLEKGQRGKAGPGSGT